MRRSPEALEHERKIAASTAPLIRRRLYPGGAQRLREVIEDPAFHSGRPSSRPRYRPPRGTPSIVHKPQSDREVYDKGLAGVRRLQRSGTNRCFAASCASCLRK